ncbi:MAG TPA: xanthine dehydrogenase family protein molybdopterin-binding subunit [Solirubrobacteraceae bacterium]|jgi:xanthine dehydrogenase YagR molybdenum-binding subunit|nr:xanthine dehydrogenase family protein molybdopterin-binding subunit [Solirubrobacteraceae bacterium]
MSTPQRVVGAPIDRVDGRLKVTGAARYAYEHPVEDVVCAVGVQSTIAKGRIVFVDAAAALALGGVIAVLWHENAPRLQTDGGELHVLQSDGVAFRGQFVAVVVAATVQIARHAAALVDVGYEVEPHDVILGADRSDLVAAPGDAADSDDGDIEAGRAAARVIVDRTYTTPAQHNNPIEAHATIALWEGGDRLTLYDANQGSHSISDDVAGAFGLEGEHVRVISPYVGGAFGSKNFTHAHVVLTAMAARAVGRAVKLELTRHEMFSLVGYRTPTIQRVRLAAGADGRLTAVEHDVVLQVSTLEDSTEDLAARPTRMMYAAPNRRTSHRMARLDLPPPTIMRAPGEAQGSFALESAIDELAIACAIDPVALRLRNEPDVDPDSGLPFSSRGLVECLRQGASRFGWQSRDVAPRGWRDGRWLVGTGVAASAYPAGRGQATATIRAAADGRYRVQIDASDIGTGAWTVLTQIAADALEVGIDDVILEIGDSALPRARAAGGSQGTASWGTAIVHAARRLREDDASEATADAGDNPYAEQYAMYAHGAQFVEVRVDADTYEIRVPRMVGVFAVGRVLNARTARSQLLGGMTWGLSMALLEESVLDPSFGDYANADLAEYHVAVNADVGEVDVCWIDEDDPYVSPMGAKGVGEIGIVGTAAAIANAIHHATGARVRDLPITLDKLLRMS